jgi:hypothetical protein
MKHDSVTRRSFIQGSLASATAVAIGVRPSGLLASPTEVVDIADQTQLLLDDWLVAELRNLKRTLHRPHKHGLIQEADGRDWQRGDAPSVVRDGSGRFHLFYRFLWEDPSVRDLHPAIGDDKAHWFRRTVGYAVSDDGVRWTKPVLGTFNGPTGFRRAAKEKWKDGVFLEPSGFSTENNLGCPVNHVQDLALHGVSDPRRRYLVNVLYRADSHNFAQVTDAGLYFASDVPQVATDPQWRERMTPIWEGPRRGPRGEATSISGYSERDALWFVCTQSSFGVWAGSGRTISRFTSGDLRHWSKEELVLAMPDDESRRREDWIEYMGIRAFRAGSLWLGQLVIFHGDRTSEQYLMPNPKTGRPIQGVWRKGTTELRLVASRDAGKTWQRVGGKQVWIPHHHEEDGYDRLVFCGSPVRVGDELWLYYSCWDGDHLVWNLDGTTYYKDRTRIGRVARATLRWDGYVSVDASKQTGALLTRPFRFNGEKLTVNLRAPMGELKAELLDPAGTVLPGFALADCTPVHGDGLELPITFTGGGRLKQWSGKPVRLRFQLTDASLYSFRFS